MYKQCHTSPYKATSRELLLQVWEQWADSGPLLEREGYQYSTSGLLQGLCIAQPYTYVNPLHLCLIGVHKH